MNWEGILSTAIPLSLAASFAQNIGVELKDVQPVQRFEQVISGHVKELNGKYKFRVSEVKYQPGGYVGDHNHARPGVRVILAGEFTSTSSIPLERDPGLASGCGGVAVSAGYSAAQQAVLEE